jgi:putative peptidoglycan lipid II flippase
LRDLFAEGALSTAFVTTFSKRIATRGDASAWDLANRFTTLTLIWMSGITLLGIFFAPLLIEQLLGRGFDASKADLTILLTRIMFPFILLVSLAALVMGILNAKHVFGIPAMASSFFNLGSILCGVLFGYLLDPKFGERALVGLAFGTLVGGLLQLTVQLPRLGRLGYRYRPNFNWRDEGVRHILQLMGPAIIAASAVQINVMVNTCFASYLGDGAISWLGYAFRLMQLPIGVFGVAVATVTLPLLSRDAARGEPERFRHTLARGLRLALFLTVPAAIGLIVLAEPIISLIFERGHFYAKDTIETAAALRCYAIGLAAYAGIKVLAPAFYAIDRRHTPMLVSILSVFLNASLNWFFTRQLHLGHRGLALSTGLVAMANLLLLYLLMRAAVGPMHTGALLGALGRILAASAGMAALCFAGGRLLFGDVHSMALVPKAFAVLVTIGSASGLYFVLCTLLGLREMEPLRDALLRRLGRTPPTPAP